MPGDHRGPLRRGAAAPPGRVHPPGAALPPVAAGGDPRHHALRPAQDIQGPPQEEARGGKQGAGVNAGGRFRSHRANKAAGRFCFLAESVQY